MFVILCLTLTVSHDIMNEESSNEQMLSGASTQPSELDENQCPLQCPASPPYRDSCSPPIYHGVSDREPPAPVPACRSFRGSPAIMNHG